MGQIDPTNPALRSVIGMLRDKRVEYDVTSGGKTHKVEFEMNGKMRRICIGLGSTGMDQKVQAVTRELKRIFVTVDQEIEEAKAAEVAKNQPKKGRSAPTIPPNYREIRYGNEGEGVMFWRTSEDPPAIDELMDQDGTVIVCTGLGKPFKPTTALTAKEPTIPKEWVIGKCECVAIAYRRITPEEQAAVDQWLEEATDPVSEAA